MMKSATFSDKFLTRISIIFVIVIFIFQAGILYRLFQANTDLLTRELNLLTSETYGANLNKRLVKGRDKPAAQIEFMGVDTPLNSLVTDTTKVVKIKNKSESLQSEPNAVAILNIALEEFVSKTNPIDLKLFSSSIEESMHRSNINFYFYVEIVDKETNKVLESTLLPTEHPSSTLQSKDIPLNLAQTKVLRVVLINPWSKVYPQMAWMLVLSLLLSLFCIYCLYFQLKTLSKQRKLAHLKSDFFSEVSHEFKRPLSVLKQAISSLDNEKIIMDAEKRGRLLKIADHEIVKMTEKTDMLLSLAMDDEGIFEIHKAEFDLVKIVYDLADGAEGTTTKPIDIDADNELKSPDIVGDKAHIEQVVSNLLGNAIKYSKAVIDIHIRLYVEGGYTCISIKDNGLGIAKEDLQVIFDKYARVAKTASIKGHGIGLNYVKRIVEKHNGLIDVKSEINVGSEFIIKLPTNGVL